jgi:DEAD/DEAH box helicase domain-containing protein
MSPIVAASHGHPADGPLAQRTHVRYPSATVSIATVVPDHVSHAIAELRAQPWVQRRLVHEEILPATSADLSPWPATLHPALTAALRARGLHEAYSHQAEAVGHALERRDVVVVTPTASGKSLCFTVPVLHSWLTDPSSRALWLFPTKALAQDQVAGLQELVAHLPESLRDQLRAATYDGDTPGGLRRTVRQDGHIVVTNPDMLHSGILPHHTGWVRLFQSLRYIVIDELHAYRGLFGSHLANVLRRLLRICAFYGSTPSVIACSATIANPREHAEALLERPVELVDRSGAPRAARHLWFWNPPLVEGTGGVRRGVVLESRRLVAELLRRDLQTIAFCRSRSSVEVLLTYLQRLVEQRSGEPPPVRGYRGGYLPLERRAIESGLRNGSVRGVVATNALELGIDIGGLDCSVLAGYPGTLASTWQQLGRAGRRDQASLGVLIAGDAAIDQFLVRHPRYLLDSPPEAARISPDNLLVVGAHLQAACFELAFEQGDSFGRDSTQLTGSLLECFADDGLVHRSGARYHWSADAFPAEAISLRRAAATNVLIIDTSSSPDGPGQGPQGAWSASGGGRPGSHGRVIGEVDQFAAPVLVHDDAIYLHEGRQFHVERLDWEEKRAYVHPVSVDHFTLAETHTTVRVLERFDERRIAAGRRGYGEVRLSRLATIYKKVRFLTHENIGAGPIMLPEQDLHTTASWTVFDPDVVAVFKRAELELAMLGLSRAMHSAACLLCMCDPRDLGSHVELRGQATPAPVEAAVRPTGPAPLDEPQEFAAGWRPGAPAADPAVAPGWPAIFLYDSTAGGVGLAERCHEEAITLRRMAAELIGACDCSGGCPSCVGPPTGDEDARALAARLAALLG